MAAGRLLRVEVRHPSVGDVKEESLSRTAACRAVDAALTEAETGPAEAGG